MNGVVGAIKKDPGPIPELNPPRKEMAAESADKLILGAVLLVAFGVLILGRIFQRRRVPIALPPEHPVAAARRLLSQIPSDTPPVEAASEAARAVREYVRTAFALGSESLTTTEVCQRFADHSLTDSNTTSVLHSFLADCDRVQFAPAGIAPPSAFTARAWTLIDELERQRGAVEPVPPPLPVAP